MRSAKQIPMIWHRFARVICFIIYVKLKSSNCSGFAQNYFALVETKRQLIKHKFSCLVGSTQISTPAEFIHGKAYGNSQFFRIHEWKKLSRVWDYAVDWCI